MRRTFGILSDFEQAFCSLSAPCFSNPLRGRPRSCFGNEPEEVFSCSLFRFRSRQENVPDLKKYPWYQIPEKGDILTGCSRQWMWQICAVR
ncbi:hypothetical protein CEXT_459081 [Caerostris extrusa]|uniref:Uncharacterized protein n=1 Tax=Caerostris extrusa TaxID=172846 RepID=A0AAV4Y4S7_CAEEX|nr:hypothetical protein CEXT_459081 [Caerostris extrusa]